MKRTISLLLSVIITASLMIYGQNVKANAYTGIQLGTVKNLNVECDNDGKVLLSWDPIFTDDFFTSNKLTHDLVCVTSTQDHSYGYSLFGYEIWRKINDGRSAWVKLITVSENKYTDLCIAAKKGTKVSYKIRAVGQLKEEKYKKIYGNPSAKKDVVLKTNTYRFWISDFVIELKNDITNKYIHGKYSSVFDDKKIKDEVYCNNNSEVDITTHNTPIEFYYHPQGSDTNGLVLTYSVITEKHYAGSLRYGEIKEYKNVLYTQNNNEICVYIPLGDIYATEYKEYLGIKEPYYLMIAIYPVLYNNNEYNYYYSENPITPEEVKTLLDTHISSVKLSSFYTEYSCEELFDLYNLQYFKGWIEPFGKYYTEDFTFYHRCHFPYKDMNN